MKRVAIALVIIVGAALLFNEKLRRDQQAELRANIARDIELRKATDIAKDPFSPSQMIAHPPPAPIQDMFVPSQIRVPTSVSKVDFTAASDRLANEQIRRDVDSLKREAELESFDRKFQQREAERLEARKEREHFLGLDHP